MDEWQAETLDPSPEALNAGPPLAFAPLLADRLPEVLRIEQLAYDHPWGSSHFVDVLQSGYLAQLLVQGPQVLGYFVAMQGVDEVHLLNITVAPDYQRQGLGRCMLDALVLWARGRQAAQIWLEVRSGNTRARKVYEDYGFHGVGTRRGYYPALGGRREDAVVMCLNLRQPDPRQGGLEGSSS